MEDPKNNKDPAAIAPILNTYGEKLKEVSDLLKTTKQDKKALDENKIDEEDLDMLITKLDNYSHTTRTYLDSYTSTMSIAREHRRFRQIVTIYLKPHIVNSWLATA